MGLTARVLPLMVAAVVLGSAGCGVSSKGSPGPQGGPAAAPEPVAVRVVHPKRGTIRHTIRQPGYIQAFEQTPMFAKIAGYVQKWNVDIGDRVHKGDTLAELYIPELTEEFKLKEAMVRQAREAYEVAGARVASAAAQVQESQAGLLRAQAQHQRWQLEYDRIAKLAGAVIDKQTKEETWNQLQSTAAAQKEAEAKIESAKAAQKESEAVRSKAQADIAAAEADRDRVAALVGYAKFTAPFDGVVTRRTINTRDFVQAPSAGKGEPLYVIERRDIMRVFVEVPETDAVWVHKGAAAKVRVQALQGQEFTGTVARTAYALDRTTRTLLAEVDLPNPQDRLRPGMYAYATLTAEQRDVWTLPAAAVVTQGEITQGYQTFCYVVRDGKAHRLPITVGARDGRAVEVMKKQAKAERPGEEGRWEDVTGDEEVVAAEAASLSDGQPVKAEQRQQP